MRFFALTKICKGDLSFAKDRLSEIEFVSKDDEDVEIPLLPETIETARFI